MSTLAGWGERRAVAAIEHTVAMGWTGIREPDGDRHDRPPEPPTLDLRAEVQRRESIRRQKEHA